MKYLSLISDSPQVLWCNDAFKCNPLLENSALALILNQSIRKQTKSCPLTSISTSSSTIYFRQVKKDCLWILAIILGENAQDEIDLSYELNLLSVILNFRFYASDNNKMIQRIMQDEDQLFLTKLFLRFESFKTLDCYYQNTGIINNSTVPLIEQTVEAIISEFKKDEISKIKLYHSLIFSNFQVIGQKSSRKAFNIRPYIPALTIYGKVLHENQESQRTNSEYCNLSTKLLLFCINGEWEPYSVGILHFKSKKITIMIIADKWKRESLNSTLGCEKFQNIFEPIITLTSATPLSRKASIKPYLKLYPGLLHFIFHNHSDNTLFYPRPLDGKADITNMIRIATLYSHKALSKGYNSISIKYDNFQFVYELWVENEAGEKLEIEHSLEAIIDKELGEESEYSIPNNEFFQKIVSTLFGQIDEVRCISFLSIYEPNVPMKVIAKQKQTILGLM